MTPLALHIMLMEVVSLSTGGHCKIILPVYKRMCILKCCIFGGKTNMAALEGCQYTRDIFHSIHL